MKAATVIAVALATLSSFPSTAQQQPAQQQQQQPTTQQQEPQMQQPPSAPTAQPAEPSAQADPNAGNAQARAAAAQLKPVTGELESKLDSQSAKQGDSVVVKTSQDVTFPGGAEIPKGSKLVGHVTKVEARGEGKENSQIAIQFDHAEMKGGQNLAIESVIQSLSPASGSGDATTNSGSSYAPAAPSLAGGTSSSSAPSGSGSSSGVNPSNSRPDVSSNTTTERGSTGQNPQSGMPAPGSIVARSGNVAIRTTAIPGVLLANDISGLPFSNASGLLLGARRDIQLDGGTQMVVAVAAAPKGAGGGMSK